MRAGWSPGYEPERLVNLDRVILGACLTNSTGSMENRMQRADMILETGIRAGLLTRVSASQYDFVVPEIGHLMAALALYGAGSPEWVQAQVQTYAARRPSDPAAVILIDFARWYAQLGGAPKERPTRRSRDRVVTHKVQRCGRPT